MENQKYINDLSEIKKMMNRSSRFISLSGLAGVFAGCYALLGAFLAKIILVKNDLNLRLYPEGNIFKSGIDETMIQLFYLALAILILAVGTAVFLTTRKATKNGLQVWDATSKRLLINFFIPLISGGIFCLVFWQYALIGLIAPAMLIFYGLALIHASKFTFSDLKGLGYANLILGFAATQFMSFGLYFWALGFGLFHIIYGVWMYNKYDRNRPE
ncbi:hypothetical protein [Christiangramia sabulilitoris]|uniref:Uncharacterized protein n=1 Tax=Christiangramia sabulilitoris TaxID=2583991 RepID=A0A550I3F1_9FLAO|nr:hypothetical protein [Christiangramia sabulilitoris]TRO65479.1 hypothetical protein FGM01_08755 [Christiangramia sabulilitoris]